MRLLLIFAPILAIAAIVLFMVFFTSIGRQVLGVGLVVLSIIILLSAFVLPQLTRIMMPAASVIFIMGMLLFIFA